MEQGFWDLFHNLAQETGIWWHMPEMLGTWLGTASTGGSMTSGLGLRRWALKWSPSGAALGRTFTIVCQTQNMWLHDTTDGSGGQSIPIPKSFCYAYHSPTGRHELREKLAYMIGPVRQGRWPLWYEKPGRAEELGGTHWQAQIRAESTHKSKILKRLDLIRCTMPRTREISNFVECIKPVGRRALKALVLLQNHVESYQRQRNFRKH